MAPRTLLKRGVELGCGTQKEAARRLNYSPEMLNKILAGVREPAPDAKPKLSQMHMIAGLALAQEVTGYNIFSYIEGDRHPQTMIRRVEKEDHEAHEALRPLGWRIIDKQKPEDLTDEDVFALKVVGKEVSERIKTDINLLIELEETFQLGLLDYLTGKKEIAQVAEPQATYNV
ncbi:helix-turn-helix transcriptional regulator [Pelotomaculum propionicicum]|uniref:Uncharacterized protein n=1 Tax=Pelotomaculum propionicicum TaxID=258475 RepID=A0A4Y7RXL3_9FIRM|nr:helix-turn-helix transcriptional regulator [Pelotomaculum propionicicum]TEB13412.1 hypothetical protein Pmgp_00306 [Pelotomaculum propionicicum]